ncbi:hypothetical protein GCM10009092_27310 [Bowmanella denitrificans]|uniref:Peptidase M14 domain-containing protein n=1 Tax=Bowmanella denitrificans TaxID=366582 RepID=A0ABN0XDK0_9ALTE
MKPLLFIMSLIMSMSLFAAPINWPSFQVPGLDKPQLRYADIQAYLAQAKADPQFRVDKIGQSFEGRDIFRIGFGQGPVRVMLWSQMHGDEPTATAAVFDLIARIQQDQAWRAQWQNKLSLYIIPMLNPDGAERATRENAQGIDINRDAAALQTPEGRILLEQAKAIKPAFGFNLHDQNRFYAAGDSLNPATISLLAPAFDQAKTISPARKKAMQLIGVLKQVADEMIPGHLGRYDDTFAPRAFGDNLAGMGISTILIESGAHRNDANRQVARTLNLAMLSAAIDSIASAGFENQSLSAYQAIPMNRREAFRDVIIKNVQVEANSQSYQLDIALDLDLPDADAVRIKEVGDLSTYTAFFTFDAEGWHYKPAREYRLDAPLVLDKAGYLALLKQGIGIFDRNGHPIENRSTLPLAIKTTLSSQPKPHKNGPAIFFLEHQDGRQMAVIQGLLIDLEQGKVLNRYST